MLGDEFEPLGPGQPGEICVRADTPAAFLGYFQNEEATAKKVVDGWLLTGDNGAADEDGHLWFMARKDDVITSSGYRIGPSEIEECLARHPAVRLAAAVGVPDPVRTEVVKAYVELRAGVTPSQALEQDIRQYVRANLAAHLCPPLPTTRRVHR